MFMFKMALSQLTLMESQRRYLHSCGSHPAALLQPGVEEVKGFERSDRSLVVRLPAPLHASRARSILLHTLVAGGATTT